MVGLVVGRSEVVARNILDFTFGFSSHAATTETKRVGSRNGFMSRIARLDVGGRDAWHGRIAQVPDKSVNPFSGGDCRFGRRTTVIRLKVRIFFGTQFSHDISLGIKDFQGEFGAVSKGFRQVVIDHHSIGRVLSLKWMCAAKSVQISTIHA